MVTKIEAKGAKVDWRAVELATEIKRTYLITDRFGKQFYKMYKPSEALDIFKKRKWSGQIVSTLDRSKKQ